MEATVHLEVFPDSPVVDVQCGVVVIDKSVVVLDCETDVPCTCTQIFPIVSLAGGVNIVLRVAVAVRISVGVKVPVVLHEVLLGVAVGVVGVAAGPRVGAVEGHRGRDANLPVIDVVVVIADPDQHEVSARRVLTLTVVVLCGGNLCVRLAGR